MRFLLISALALLVAPVAVAKDRLSDADFVRLSSCVAFAKSAALGKDGDYSSAVALEKQERRRRAPHVAEAAGDAAYQAESAARRAKSAAELQSVRTQRDVACAGFVETGFASPTPSEPQKG